MQLYYKYESYHKVFVCFLFASIFQLLRVSQEVVSRGGQQADESSDAEAARALAAHRRALKQAKRNQTAHRVRHI